MHKILVGGIAAIAVVMAGSAVQAATLKARATLVNAQNQPVGTVDLTEEKGKGVTLTARVNNLPPGLHSIHVHDGGSCVPPDFKSAGEHFNPGKKQHGFMNPKGPHAGDLPNIVVGPDGNGEMTVTTKLVTLAKDKKNSLLKAGGTSIVIHEKADDFVTDPDGGGGTRIACGPVMEIKEEKK